MDIATPPEVTIKCARSWPSGSKTTLASTASRNFLCVANLAGNPLKYTLCVWWEYSHSGTLAYCNVKFTNPHKIILDLYEFVSSRVRKVRSLRELQPLEIISFFTLYLKIIFSLIVLKILNLWTHFVHWAEFGQNLVAVDGNYQFPEALHLRMFL